MILAAAMIALMLSWETRAAQPRSAELRGGRWVEVDAPATAPAGADAQLERIERLVQQDRHAAARARLVRWFKHNPNALARERALMLMAEALYGYGDRIRAFYYLDELMDTYPDSPLFNRALEMQYQIADAYLDGYKRRFLRIPMFTAYDEAIDMLYRIQSRAPGSQMAERALLRTADFYYADAQYDLSADAYQAYARAYPRSSALPRVRLRQAFSNYAQFRGLRFDATPLVDARAQLGEIIATYPDLAEEEGLRAVIERIDRTFAQKLYATADFYRRTNEPQAAAYTYRVLIDAYPNTPEAGQAHEALARLPDTPKRGSAPGEPVTTRPAGGPVSALER